MLLSLESAKRHLRILGDDDDIEIAEKSAAAEQIARGYLNRRVYADQSEMDAAVALVPAGMVAAGVAFVAADAAADLVDDPEIRAIEKKYARDVYSAYFRAAASIRNGIIINPLILAAMALILGDLWERREDSVVGVSVAKIPFDSRRILDALRISPGV